eukprot:5616022-Amphidinium_carterae.1
MAIVLVSKTEGLVRVRGECTCSTRFNFWPSRSILCKRHASYGCLGVCAAPLTAVPRAQTTSWYLLTSPVGRRPGQSGTTAVAGTTSV